ncbi:unnamed protein product [Bemisia tabaci]|uniref:Fatty acid desaturase domain-containing protein n=1 Tax=Bemisia tabaci TaxID=7038 RepID=A0A9P0AHI1_BEMTA|nr:unnamed protein product [Bemisia tabaci]
MQLPSGFKDTMGWVQTEQPIIWSNVFFITAFHIIGLHLFIFHCMRAKLLTWAWNFLMGGIGGFGVTAGAHRLWAHRSYKAKLPLKIILILCYSVAGQNTIFDWVRDHRIHHKFSETAADPHDSNRGFFFAHVGWLMQRKRPEVLEKGRKIDMSDITSDPWISFHHRHFTLFKIVFCFIIPSVVPWLAWGEPLWLAAGANIFVRYVLNLNFTWFVNSAAHIWGYKPFDARINPRENLGVSIVAMGEGWHNYHHTFPWDYKAAELGNYKVNITTMWLDFFAKIGWAYDMKTASPGLIKQTAMKHGDGTHPVEVPFEENANYIKPNLKSQ